MSLHVNRNSNNLINCGSVNSENVHSKQENNKASVNTHTQAGLSTHTHSALYFCPTMEDLSFLLHSRQSLYCVALMGSASRRAPGSLTERTNTGARLQLFRM